MHLVKICSVAFLLLALSGSASTQVDMSNIEDIMSATDPDQPRMPFNLARINADRFLREKLQQSSPRLKPQLAPNWFLPRQLPPPVRDTNKQSMFGNAPWSTVQQSLFRRAKRPELVARKRNSLMRLPTKSSNLLWMAVDTSDLSPREMQNFWRATMQHQQQKQLAKRQQGARNLLFQRPRLPPIVQTDDSDEDDDNEDQQTNAGRQQQQPYNAFRRYHQMVV